MLRRSPAVWKNGVSGISDALGDICPPWGRLSSTFVCGAGSTGPAGRAQSTPVLPAVATVAISRAAVRAPRLALRERRPAPGRGPGRSVGSGAMPKVLFVTLPTDEGLNKEGKVRFPGTDAAVDKRTEAGWEVEVMRPDWPKPLEEAKSGGYHAILVSTFKSVPRSRDAASMLSRMQDLPVYTVGVLQRDDAFRTSAPDVGVLRNIGELPDPS